MSKSNRLVLGAMLTLGLGAPALAWGQAVPRGSAPSGGSSSSGSSGGGSSSSSSGGGSSDSGSSPTYSPPPPPPQRTPPPPRVAPPDADRSGGAVRRGTSSASAPSAAGSTGGRSDVSVGDPGRSNSGDADARSRSRNGRPVTGLAIERDDRLGGGGSAYSGDLSRSYPFSWYYGYPLYGAYSSYNRYGYNRYGVWYDPYDPFGYYDPIYSDPMGYGGYGGYGASGGRGYSSSSSGPAPRDEATGTIRLRVKPAFGKVYLDGTLIGVVDEFDGLSSHLAATVGRHELEVRADGYESLKMVVNVDEDKTTTARGSMKKK